MKQYMICGTYLANFFRMFAEWHALLTLLVLRSSSSIAGCLSCGPDPTLVPLAHMGRRDEIPYAAPDVLALERA